MNGMRVDDFTPPPPAVRVELSGVYADDLRPLGDFSPTPINVELFEEQIEELSLIHI